MRPSSVKYAAIFAATAAGLIGLAVVAAPKMLLPVIVATSFAWFVVAAAYGMRRPRWLGKRATGRMSPVHGVLLLPYHLLLSVSFWMFRLMERASPWCEVQPGLLLGRRLTAAEASGVSASHVLDLTAEFAECAAFSGRTYRCVPMLDGTAPSLAQLRQAVDWLHETAGRGTRYVHCALGHGRSATVVIAYLLRAGHVRSVEEGVQLVCAHRPGVRLSRGQRALLEQWANDLSYAFRQDLVRVRRLFGCAMGAKVGDWLFS